jgi:hypothetical protein
MKAQAQIPKGNKQATSLVPTGLLQGKKGPTGMEEESRRKRQMLQRRAVNNNELIEVTPSVHEVLRLPGQPLDAETRAFMEPKLGQDFSRIPAYTPIAGVIQAKLVINKPGDEYEQEADRIADAIVSSKGYSAMNKITSIPEGELQREEGGKPPKSDAEKYKEALKKAGEAFLQTNTGKQIKDKAEKLGKDFVSTLPGKIIAGSAAAGIVTAIAATNSELPMQIPEIPLDIITPGLKIKLTYEGPVRKPTSASITFIFEEQIKKTEKEKRTEKEKYRAETARMAEELEQFREGLKTPEQRAAEQEMFWQAFWRMKGPYGIEPLNIPGLRQKRKEEVIQRKPVNNDEISEVPPIVHEVLGSPGQPLDLEARIFMEPRFGHDFSKVRVHTDAKATESARTIGAAAYTVGYQIVFDKSRYLPDSTEGRYLLAHELAHVVQQRFASFTSQLRPLGEPTNPFEIEADRASNNVMQNQRANVGLITSVVTPQFGLIGCLWWMWWYSKYMEECRSEYEKRCGKDMLTEDCQDFMDGAGFPSDAILKCIGRKNPKAMARLLSSCSTASFGRIFRGPRASIERPSGTPPPDMSKDEETTTSVA